MTGDAVVRCKIKTVLFITIGIITDMIIAVDVQALTTKYRTFGYRLDRCTVAVHFRMFDIPQQCIWLLYAEWMLRY